MHFSLLSQFPSYEFMVFDLNACISLLSQFALELFNGLTDYWFVFNVSRHVLYSCVFYFPHIA
jgi:hypothetical protein